MAIVDLNVAGLGLISTEADITPAWVQGVLHGSGDLDKNITVTDVTIERIGEGVGILSILQKITPTYSAPTSAPKTIVAKYPTDDAGQRYTADALALYIRELLFYREIAGSAPFRTARCYAQAKADDNTDFTIVMEDIGSMRALNQLEGVSLSDSKILLNVLADFHAMWWDSPKLPAMNDVFQPLSNPTYHAVLPMLWGGGWPAVMQHAADIVPSSVAPIGDIWANKVQWMLDNLMSPVTLCHGDYRADNIMFDGDKPAVIDFQISGLGSGMYDVGYFISQSIDSKVRSGHDRELVDGYLDRLKSHGITVDREESWRQYLIAITFCVTYSVTNYPQFDNMNERGKKLLRDMLARSLQAVVDNDALSVFH